VRRHPVTAEQQARTATAGGPHHQTTTSRHDDTFAWRDGRVRWHRQGSGPAVVLCHGTPWSAQLWDGVADSLAHEWTVYRFDMIGYGRSEQRPGQDVSLGSQGALFADLLEHWQLERPAVVAHDYGGAVALRAHLLHGRQFSSMTLIDVVALAPWGSAFFRLVGDHASVFEQLPPDLHRALVEQYVRGASHRGLSSEALGALIAPWIGRKGQAAFYRQIAQADQRFTDDIEPRYATLEIPVHLIWGAEDRWIPPERAHRLHAMIAGSTLQLIEGAGHLVQFDAPDELNAAIHRALR
jgi:pimeloyl-ACP methyl ester carboxylesterase